MKACVLENAGCLVVSGMLILLIFGFASGPSSGDLLVMASRKNNMNRVTALLASGVDIDYRAGTQKRTPLMVAAANGSYECVILLVKRGAKVNMQDASGTTALDFAQRAGNTNVVTFLSGAIRH